MATAYHRLYDPLSSIRLDEGEVHDSVRIWERGAFCGELTFTAGVGREAVKWFMDEKAIAMRTYWGGEARGLVVMECEPHLAADLQLISDLGEIVTVGDVRKRAGESQGRSSGS